MCRKARCRGGYKKVSKQKGRRKRQGKYDDGRAVLCVACVDAAKSNSSTAFLDSLPRTKP